MESKNITFTTSPPFPGFEYPAAACMCGSAPPMNAAHAELPDIRGALTGTGLVRLDSAAEWIITTTTGAVMSRNTNARLHRVFGRHIIVRHAHGAAEIEIECITGRTLGRYAAPSGADAPALREIDGRLVITWPSGFHPGAPSASQITIIGFNFAPIATIPRAHLIDTSDPRIWVMAHGAAPHGAHGAAPPAPPRHVLVGIQSIGPPASGGTAPPTAAPPESKSMVCYYDVMRNQPIHIMAPGTTFRAWAAPRIAAESAADRVAQFRHFIIPTAD